MIPYFILLLSFPATYVGLTAWVKNDKRRQLLGALIPSLLLFLIMGCKGFLVGADTPSYIEFYENATQVSWGYYHHHIEIGYYYVTEAFALLGLDYRIYQLFFYFVICFCLFYASYKLSRNTVMSLYIFASFLYMNFFISGLRQGLAISLCLLAFSLVFKNKITIWRTLAYFGLVALAASFHESALIFVLPFFLLRFRLLPKGLFILVFFSIAFYLFGSQIYELIYELTSNTYPPFTAGVGKISMLFILMAVFAFFLTYPSTYRDMFFGFFDRKVFKKGAVEEKGQYVMSETTHRELSVLILLVFFGAWLENTSRFNSGFGRISMYFSILVIFLVPNALENISNRRTKYCLMGLLALAYCAFFIYYSVAPNNMYLGPYALFF